LLALDTRVFVSIRDCCLRFRGDVRRRISSDCRRRATREEAEENEKEIQKITGKTRTRVTTLKLKRGDVCRRQAFA
jgi:hypothetical protein